MEQKPSQPKTWQDHTDEWSQTYIQESFVFELKKASLPETLAESAISAGKEALNKVMSNNLVEALNKPAVLPADDNQQTYAADTRILTLGQFWNLYTKWMGDHLYARMRREGVEDILSDSISELSVAKTKDRWATDVNPDIQRAMENTKVFLPPLRKSIK